MGSQVTWFGTRVEVRKATGSWATVAFLEPCSHFNRGDIVHLSTVNLVMDGGKSPVMVTRTPYAQNHKSPVTITRNPYNPSDPEPNVCSQVIEDRQAIESTEDLIDLMDGYIHAIAFRQVGSNNLDILLGADDIRSELYIEMIKCYERYGDKDRDSLIKLAKTMASHRMGELIHRHHGTHRQAGHYNLDLDDSEGVQDSVDLERDVVLNDDMRAFFDTLTEVEAEIVKALLNPNDRRMRFWMRLNATRRSAAFKKPTITVTPYVVANALHMDIDETRQLFKSIEDKWRGMND